MSRFRTALILYYLTFYHFPSIILIFTFPPFPFSPFQEIRSLSMHSWNTCNASIVCYLQILYFCMFFVDWNSNNGCMYERNLIIILFKNFLRIFKIILLYNILRLFLKFFPSFDNMRRAHSEILKKLDSFNWSYSSFIYFEPSTMSSILCT